MLSLALIREIEVIGEAASRVSDEIKNSHSEIPWGAIIGTRNRLIHGYFDVDLDIVWATVKTDLPALGKQLKPLLKRKKFQIPLRYGNSGKIR